MAEDRTIDEFHRDPEGKHYFAFIDPTALGRICIDCGAPE